MGCREEVGFQGAQGKGEEGLRTLKGLESAFLMVISGFFGQGAQAAVVKVRKGLSILKGGRRV